jgi:hypothetical protein
MNPNIQKSIKVATIAGAAILVVKSAASVLSVKSPKEAIMPVVSILVGIAAFNYALKSGSIVVSEKK